ncbi:MAG TPA: TonB-dependent receptor [Bacteroidia bacterium]|nr:TonB-dependent receptor [Bacteroidia bacterium]
MRPFEIFSVFSKRNSSGNIFRNGLLVIILALGSTAVRGQYFIQLGDSAGKAIDGAIVNVIPVDVANPYKSAKLLFSDEKGTVNSPIGGRCLVRIDAENFAFYEDTLVLTKNAAVVIKLEERTFITDETVVTAIYEPTTTDKTVPKVKIIDAKRIQAQGAVTLKDVLSNELNVRLKQDNILGSSLSLQGIGGQNIKILIDGVPMIGRMDGNIDLSQINLNNIERIEIIEGPMSVMYGTDALGGIINLITKKTGKHSLEGNLNTYYETTGNYNIDGRLAFKSRRNTSVQVSGGRNFFDGFGEHGLRGRQQQWKPKEQYFADAIVGFNIKKSNHRFQSQYFHELLLNRGEPVILPYSAYAYDNYFYTTRINNSLFSNFTLKNGARVQLINSLAYFERQNIQQRRNLLTLEDKLTQGQDDHDTSVFWLQLHRGTYTQAVNKKFSFQAGYDINIETGTGQRIEGHKQTLGDYAVYATAEYKPWTRLVLRPGLRASHNTAYGSPVTPSFNLKYDISTKMLVRASYARGFRAPALKELYLFFVDVNHNIQPAKDLQAELSDNYTVSGVYSQNFRGFRLRIEPGLFHNRIYNMISLAIVDASSQLYSYVNIGEYSNAGANLSAELKSEKVTLQAGAAFTGIKNYLPGTEPYSTTTEYRASAGYTFDTKTQVSVYYKYNGKVPGFALDANNQVYQTFIQPYAMADVSVTQPFLKGQINLVVGSRNVFDVKTINYNAPTGGAHTGGGSSMNIGMGRSYFMNVRIFLFNQAK